MTRKEKISLILFAAFLFAFVLALCTLPFQPDCLNCTYH
jgi:hypothetical protein